MIEMVFPVVSRKLDRDTRIIFGWNIDISERKVLKVLSIPTTEFSEDSDDKSEHALFRQLKKVSNAIAMQS